MFVVSLAKQKNERKCCFFSKKTIFHLHNISSKQAWTIVPNSNINKNLFEISSLRGVSEEFVMFFSMHPQHFSSSKKTKYALSMKNVSPLSSKNDANANEFNEYFMKFFHSIMIAKLWDDEDDDDGGRWMETLTRRRVFTRE